MRANRSNLQQVICQHVILTFKFSMYLTLSLCDKEPIFLDLRFTVNPIFIMHIISELLYSLLHCFKNVYILVNCVMFEIFILF